MRKFLTLIGITAFLLFGIAAFVFSQQTGTQSEQLTITTYYPSPYGSYNELQLYPHQSSSTTCGPNTPDVKGTIWFYSDPTDLARDEFRVCDGTTWVSLGKKIGDELYLAPHTQRTICNASTEGTIYYDSNAHKIKVCNGTSWIVLGGIPRSPKVEKFTTPGSFRFSIDPQATWLEVEAWGGGGGGGASLSIKREGGGASFYNKGGGGGGGGAYGKQSFFPPFPVSGYYNASVGYGGSGLYRCPLVYNQDGGASSFGNITFGGGQKGNFSAVFGLGAGGQSNATDNWPGGNGQEGIPSAGGIGGAGGGGGGAGGSGATATTRANGSFPGGGGGGGYDFDYSCSQGVNGDGGAGANGQVIVTTHFD